MKGTNVLDDIPMATILAIASVVIVIIAYISNDLNVDEALVALGAALGGAGVLGHARNGANRGVRR